MVLASHVIFTTYGFWLPNDPRGSWSKFVGSWELLRFGPATKIEERQSLASAPHDEASRIEAKQALKYPPVELSGVQALEVARGFSVAIEAKDYQVYACAILPNHMHMVIGRHARDAEDIVAHLKYRASRRLIQIGLHPFGTCQRRDGKVPSMWTKRAWRVYLESEEDVERAVEYVENNPVKEGTALVVCETGIAVRV